MHSTIQKSQNCGMPQTFMPLREASPNLAELRLAQVWASGRGTALGCCSFVGITRNKRPVSRRS